jgi:hypothetical protein
VPSIDGRPYLQPIESADRCTVGETVAVVSRDEPLKMSASALPIDKFGRMKPVQLMSALYHEQKPSAKRRKQRSRCVRIGFVWLNLSGSSGFTGKRLTPSRQEKP